MTTIGSFHGENGGAPANVRGRAVVATALMVLGRSAGAVFAHENGERSEQTVIKSREVTIPKGQCSQLPAELEVKGRVSSVLRPWSKARTRVASIRVMTLKVGSPTSCYRP